MWNQVKMELQDLTWSSVLLSVLALSFTWLVAPFSYIESLTSHATYTTNFAALILYILCIALSFTIASAHDFVSILSLGPIILSLIVAFIGFFNRPIIMALLMLLPLYLFIIQLPATYLRNTIGLITIGGLFTLSIPVAAVYLVTHRFAWSALIYCLPLALTTWMFLTPFFIRVTRIQSIFITIVGALLLIAILTRPLGIGMILALVAVVISWFWLLSIRKQTPYLAALSTVQLLIMVLIYWT